jgi:hypothetical protein
MSSTSEDDTTIQDTNENTWQKVKNSKRRKVNQPASQNITLTNKYSQLNVEDDENTTTKVIENKIQKPPPIFVYGVTIITWYITCAAQLNKISTQLKL